MTACETCGRAFRPRDRAQRACSLACRRPWAARRREVLALLDANRRWFLTLSDLAIWIVGDDTRADREAMRNQLYWLRKRGYRFEVRTAVWTGAKNALAYRLASGPAVAARRTA